MAPVATAASREAHVGGCNGGYTFASTRTVRCFGAECAWLGGSQSLCEGDYRPPFFLDCV